MATGLTPKHTQDVTFENFNQEQILVIALEAAKGLEWNVKHIRKNGFIAYSSAGSWSQEITIIIDGHNVSLKSESPLFDFGKNRKNIEEFLQYFKSYSSTLPFEELANKVHEHSAAAAEATDQEELLQPPAKPSRNAIIEFFALFIPIEGYYITPILVLLNILVFIVMAASGVHVFEPDTESLIHWGANFRPITLDGQWWRLLTSCFLHIGIFHLLMNMYALLYIGQLLEPKLGRSRFLAAYLLAGIAGSSASLYWNDLTVSAGASGAIFGMYGVFLAMLTTSLIEKAARKTLLTSILIFVVFNLANGLKAGIDNAAHIGGLLSGIIIGYIYYPGLKRPQELNLKYLSMVAPTLLIGLISFLVYTYTTNDLAELDKRMNRIASLETEALEVYSKVGNTPYDVLLTEISEKGLKNWKECITLINEAEQLNIPDQFHRRNKVLLKYCELRIKSYEILYLTFKEDTDKYKEQLEDFNNQIQTVLNELQEEKF